MVGRLQGAQRHLQTLGGQRSGKRRAPSRSWGGSRAQEGGVRDALLNGRTAGPGCPVSTPKTVQGRSCVLQGKGGHGERVPLGVGCHSSTPPGGQGKPRREHSGRPGPLVAGSVPGPQQEVAPWPTQQQVGVQLSWEDGSLAREQGGGCAYQGARVLWCWAYWAEGTHSGTSPDTDGSLSGLSPAPGAILGTKSPLSEVAPPNQECHPRKGA